MSNVVFNNEEDVPYTIDSVRKMNTCPFCSGQKSDPWEFIDVIYCINLKDRTDRRDKAEEELHRVGLCIRTKMYLADRAQRKDNGFGCFNSHKRVAQLALQTAQANTCMVLEDDFVFDKQYTDIYALAAQVKTAMESLPSDWKRLQLGGQSLLFITYNRYVRRSMSAFAHALIWSQSGLQYMANMDYPNNYHDHKLMFMGRSFDIYPMVCYQRILGTDNSSSLHENLFQNEQGMKTMNWLIPVLTTLIVLVIFAISMYITKRVKKKWSWWKIFIIVALVFLIPITIVFLVLYLT